MQKYSSHLSLLVGLLCPLVICPQVFSKPLPTHATSASPPVPYVDKTPVVATKSVAATPNTTALVNAVREAKIINPAFELHLAIEGDTAKVNTARELADKEDDCKIDAVIIGKTIMAKDPSIKNVVVLFRPDSEVTATAGTDDKLWRVLVTAAEIEQFKTGNMNKQALLSLLEVKHLPRRIKSQSPAAVGASFNGQARGAHPRHEPGVWQSSARVYKNNH
jgi:hypothetical protein